MPALIFTDTTLWLDFYRQRGRGEGLSVLKHIDNHLEHFIVSFQVEMEFKKNRQQEILKFFDLVKSLNFNCLQQAPAILAESRELSKLNTLQKDVKSASGRLQKRTERILHQPIKYDCVYKTAQRFFGVQSDYNLSQDKEEMVSTIKELARDRFSLGYPPRKNNDTSMGDALNWEWIIHCARESGRDVVIVSRDSDYGPIGLDKRPVLNGWLDQEFHDRVSRKRKLILTNRLTEGLKAAGIKTTKEEEEAENTFLEDQRGILRLRALDQMLEQLNSDIYSDVLNTSRILDAVVRKSRLQIPPALKEFLEKGPRPNKS